MRRFPSSGLLVKKVTNQVLYVSLLLSMGAVRQGLRKCLSGSSKFLFKQLNIGS